MARMGQRRCICSEPERCLRIVNRFANLGDKRRLAYFIIRAEPKEPKSARKPAFAAQAAHTAKQREVVLRHLGRATTALVSKHEAEGLRQDELRWSAIHLHPSVLAQLGEGEKLPSSVSSDIATSVDEQGFSYTLHDRFMKSCFVGGSVGSYAVAPNYPYAAAEEELSLRERASSMQPHSSAETSASSSSSPLSSSSTTASGSTLGGDPKRRRVGPEERRLVALGADALAAKVCVSEMQIEQLTKELTGERVARVKAEDDCKAAVAAAHEVAAKKFDEMLLIEGGLSRTTLLSSKWHKRPENK